LLSTVVVKDNERRNACALVEVALAAGLRLDPVPGLLLLSETVHPPTALAIGGYYMLF